jgi:arylsulfatase A-like enzyme
LVLAVTILGLSAGCTSAPAAAPASPPSILLVSLDTLRADRLGVLGNHRGLTPNLDAFAKDAVVFEQAWSQSDITSMSHASLFTSRYPSELGMVGPTFHLGRHAPTLADVLGVYGYDTAAFTAGGHMSRGSGLDRGFTVFEPTRELGSFWHTVPRAVEWLDERASAGGADKPFFLLVHTYDVHEPYLDPAPYGLAWADPAYTGPAADALDALVGTNLVFDHTWFRAEGMLGLLEERGHPRIWDADAHAALAALASRPELEPVPFGDADFAHVRNVYDGAAAYADAYFGRLVADLRARGRYDDTIIVVFSDHGEALGEDGRFGHGDSLADWELHVPLLLKVPGGTGRHVDAPVALLDVMPTLLELAGATPPAGLAGQSLVPWLRGGEGPSRPEVYAEGNTREVSVRSTAGRLTFAGVAADSPFLPGLLRTAAIDGPAFASDTTVTDPAAREALRARLLAWRAGLELAGASVPADPKMVEQMRTHGYWDAK